MPEEENLVHEIITDGGMYCSSCGTWRNLLTINKAPARLSRCHHCGDEGFDLWDEPEATNDAK